MTTANFQIFPESLVFKTLIDDIDLAFQAFPLVFPNPIPIGVVQSTPPQAEFVLVSIVYEPMYTQGYCIVHYDVRFSILCHAQTSQRAAVMRTALATGLIKRFGGKEIIANDEIQTKEKYWITVYRTAPVQTGIRPFQIQGEQRMIAPLGIGAIVTHR